MTEFQREYWERDKLNKRRTPTHPVVAAYVRAKLDQVSRHVPLEPGTSLLDVGCGNGFFTHHLAERCAATGVDYSAKMLSLNPAPRRVRSDANRLAFADNAFEVVFCHALLHHVDDMDRVVREMARVSRRHVVILEPNRNNPLMFLFSLLVAEERKALRFSLGYVRRLVARNGLRIAAAFSHGMIVPNKTPTGLLPLIRALNFRQPLGMTNIVIGEKTG